MSIALAALDRQIARDGGSSLPMVSLVNSVCRRCEMAVLMVRVGEERFPVLLELSQVTVVAESGRVSIGHPVHDPGTCAVREAYRP